MKVSNRPSSNVLAALVSAAVLIGSSVGVAHAEDGAQRLIELRSKTALSACASYRKALNEKHKARLKTRPVRLSLPRQWLFWSGSLMCFSTVPRSLRQLSCAILHKA